MPFCAWTHQFDNLTYVEGLAIHCHYDFNTIYWRRENGSKNVLYIAQLGAPFAISSLLILPLKSSLHCPSGDGVLVWVQQHHIEWEHALCWPPMTSASASPAPVLGAGGCWCPPTKLDRVPWNDANILCARAFAPCENKDRARQNPCSLAWGKWAGHPGNLPTRQAKLRLRLVEESNPGN